MYSVDLRSALTAITGIKGWVLEREYKIAGDTCARFVTGRTIAAVLRVGREELYFTLEDVDGRQVTEDTFELSCDPARVDERIRSYVKALAP
jgi:hypothetical protein